jgi:3-deoxy-D-manno-octulosonic-acid transferase
MAMRLYNKIERGIEIQMKILYNIGTQAYYFLVWIASAWNSKAAKWIVGRRGWRNELKDKFGLDDKVIWVHCASLGEFEQGRPLIEKIRSGYTDYKILLTFFSPSGYEKRKDYKLVDHVCYLPMDSGRNARDFLNLVPVSKVFFIKYEFWYHFLKRINDRGIPLYLASGNFQKTHLFFKWYASWYRKIFGFFTHIFVQDSKSLELLKSAGYNRVMVAGDTRFDRVTQISSTAKQINEVSIFAGDSPVIIAGSTWEKDEEYIAHAFNKLKGRCKLIVAPHEPLVQQVNKLKNCFPDHLLFSELSSNQAPDKDVLIVDTIGHLSSLYRYGSLGYIGGGFGKGIHNILEATAAGLPVVFGPNYHRFKEAEDLKSKGAAFVVKQGEEVYMIFDKLLSDQSLIKQYGDIAKNYTLSNTGASEKIIGYVFANNE